MTLRRSLTLGLVGCGLAAGGLAAAVSLAEAKQNGVVVQRFLLGYMDSAQRFVPTAGRGATNVDRNALAMFVFSGPIDTGPNTRASLPLTVQEQEVLAQQQAQDPNFDPEENGYEPGVIPRKQSPDVAAYYVATGSINRTSVLVAAAQAGGTLADAPGQFFKVLRRNGEVAPNKLLFNPRYAVSSYNRPQQIDYNPVGLDGRTQFEVYVDGGPSPIHPFELVRNLDGMPLGVPFQTSFTTTDRYVQDFTRPLVKETSPTDGTINVPADADIDITFTEPMDISSFVTPRFQGDDQWTVIARYSQAAINQALAGRNLITSVRIKPQTGGNVVQIRPLQGFGKGPAEIEVIVRNAVTDLSGNNITRQIQFTFRSKYDPAADLAGFAEEKFADSSKRDTTFSAPSGDNILASWNTALAPGFLTTAVTETYFQVAGPRPSGTGVNVWASFAIQFQALFPQSDMGARSRTISGFSWVPGVFLGLSYPNCTVQLGHAQDLIALNGFPGTTTTGPGPSPTNFRDSPVTVFLASTYSTVGQSAGGAVRGPLFTRNFTYDGQNALILDITHGGAGATQERWQIDQAYSMGVLTVNIPSNATAPTGTYPWYLTTRFHYLTPGAEAQSLFYDLGRDDARMLPQQIVPMTQPVGTSVTFQWQGAKSSIIDPSVPDTATLTPWLADLRQLSTYRFIRFRATLLNNLTAKTSPAVDTLTLPFTFK